MLFSDSPGLSQVRPHLNNVDDIPLRVPTFANCTPAAVQEMIHIYQEYGEVVCCIGTSADATNAGTFATVRPRPCPLFLFSFCAPQCA